MAPQIVYDPNKAQNEADCARPAKIPDKRTEGPNNIPTMASTSETWRHSFPRVPFGRSDDACRKNREH